MNLVFNGNLRTIWRKDGATMKFTLRSRERVPYSSLLWRSSTAISGVRYAIRKISLGQRIELTRKAREASIKNEFLRAGDDLDQLEASLSDLLVRKLYLQWALVAIEGLTIDDQPPSVCDLI